MAIKKRAQVSAELMILISVIMVIFIFVSFSAYENSARLSSVINEKYAKEQAFVLAQEINHACISGNGYSKQINFPVTLRTGLEYNLTISSAARRVIVQWGEMETRAYSYPILASNITGSLVNINKTSVSISNQNGRLTIG